MSAAREVIERLDRIADEVAEARAEAMAVMLGDGPTVEQLPGNGNVAKIVHRGVAAFYTRHELLDLQRRLAVLIPAIDRSEAVAMNATTEPAAAAAPRGMLSQREAARVLGLSNDMTLAAWRLRKQGPAYVRVGRSIRYRVEDIEAYIASNRETPGSGLP